MKRLRVVISAFIIAVLAGCANTSGSMVGTAGITGDVFAGEYQPSGAWPVQRWDNDE